MHPEYRSGLYYITFDNTRKAALSYCDQETAGGGWTLFYANAAYHNMTKKKSYNEYMQDRKNDNLADLSKYGYRSKELGGMLDFDEITSTYSLMGKDIGGRWKDSDYAILVFPSNTVLQSFLKHTLVSGNECSQIPNGETFTYRNSNGMEYQFNSLKNYNGQGYGWQDCMTEKPAETPGSNVENCPRHVLYAINDKSDTMRVRGIFGFIGDDATATARYFIRPRRDLQPPIPVLSSNTGHPASIVPITVTLTFSEEVFGMNATGIECNKCKVYNFVKSPATDYTYIFDVHPTSLEDITIGIAVKEGVCEDMDHLKNVASVPLNYSITGDFYLLKYAQSPVNESFGYWLNNWKSKDANYLYGTFGIQASGHFRIGLSSSKSISHPMLILDLGDGNNRQTHKIIRTNADGKENVLVQKEYDLKITSYDYSKIFFIYNYGQIVIGLGDNITTPGVIEYSCQESEKVKVQYASYGSSPVSGIVYMYPSIGPLDDSAEFTVKLNTSAPTPAFEPFYVTLVFNRNVLTLSKSGIVANDKGDWLSDLEKITDRIYIFKVSPEVTSDTTVTILLKAGAAVSVDGAKLKESLPLVITYRSSKLSAKLTPECPESGYNIVPMPLTLTFNRDVVDFTVEKLMYYWNVRTIENFHGNNKTYTFDIVPFTRIAAFYIESGNIHDEAGQANEELYFYTSFGAVKNYTMIQYFDYYPLWLNGWSTNTVGTINGEFRLRTIQNFYIGLSTSTMDISNRYEFALGFPSTNSSKFTLNSVKRYYDGASTTLTSVDKQIFSPGKWRDVKFYVNEGNITLMIGNDTLLSVIDPNPLRVEFASFSIVDVQADIRNIAIGPNAMVSPTVNISTDSSNPARSIPIWVTVTFSTEVVEFDKNDIIPMNGYASNLTDQGDQKHFMFELYPTKTDYFCGVTIRAGAALSKEGRFPSKASNPFFITASDILEFDLDPMNGNFYLWYDDFYSLNPANSWATFTAYGSTSFYLAFGADQSSGANRYELLYDGPNHINSISRVYQGKKTQMTKTTKEIAKGDAGVNLWGAVINGEIKMGLGTVVGEQEIISYQDSSVIPVEFISWSTGAEPALYKNIKTGEHETSMSVTITTNMDFIVNTAPVTAIFEFAHPVEEFLFSKIKFGDGCEKGYNVFKIDDYNYAIGVFYKPNHTCSFYLPGHSVSDLSGNWNAQSNTIIINPSDEVFRFAFDYSMDHTYSFYYDNWKSFDSSETNITFDVKCSANVYIALSEFIPINTTSYEIILGAQYNTEIRLNSLSSNGDATLLSRSNVPVCNSEEYVAIYITVANTEKGVRITVGSGKEFNENLLLRYFDSSASPIKQKYVLFRTEGYGFDVKNIAVGPAGGDISAPTATISTKFVNPTSSLPVTCTLAFSEPVQGMSMGLLKTVNVQIQEFYQLSSALYFFSAVPISSQKDGTVQLPEGLVIDRAGNGNQASNVLTIQLAASVFDFELVGDQFFHYSYYYDQWKSAIPGEVMVDFYASGEKSLCVEMISDPNVEYPYFEFCVDLYGQSEINQNGQTPLVKVDSTDWVVPDEYRHFGFGVKDGVLTAYYNHVAVMSHKFVSDEWKTLQYVSFTGNYEPISIRQIRVTPYNGGTDKPLPTLLIKTEEPINQVPISMELSYNIPVTGVYDESVLNITEGRGYILNFENIGGKYLFDFIPYVSNSTTQITVLADKAISRMGVNSSSSITSVKIGTDIKYYLALPLYNDIGFRNSAWQSSRYGHVYVIFDARCSNDMTIILTTTLKNANPKYIITLGSNKNTRTEIQRVQNDYIGSVSYLGERPMCNDYRNVSYWIEQKSGEIHIGSGRTLGKNTLYKYSDSQPFPSRYVSFSAWDTTVLYSNIEVGPYDKTSVEGIIFTDEFMPTNVNKIVCEIYWTNPVEDFTISDIVATSVNVNNLTAKNSQWFTFDVYPQSCGVHEIYIPANAVWTKEGIKNNATLPLYIEWCNERPKPVMYVPTPISVEYTPIPVYIEFKRQVYGFTVEDFTLTGDKATATLLTQLSNLMYKVLITPSGDSTNNVNIQIKENQLQDVYGNNNEATLIYRIPRYSSNVKSFSANESYYNVPLILSQWSTKNAGICTIKFEALCSNDMYISFSKGFVEDEDSYQIVPGASGNTESRIQIGDTVMKYESGAVCKSWRYVSYWASFNKREISFGLGKEIGKNVTISYTDTKDRENMYIGLSNWDNTILYRNIEIGPDSYMPVRASIKLSTTHYYTNQNPIKGNLTFTKAVKDFDQSKLNITGGSTISSFNKKTNLLYEFEITPKEGYSTINLPSDSVVGEDGKNNEESNMIGFYYTEAGLYGSFSSPVDDVVEIPFPLMMSWNKPVLDFSTDKILSSSSGYYNATPTTGSIFYFSAAYTESLTKISIPEKKITSTSGDANLNVETYEVPPYASPLKNYNIPANQNGEPFAVNTWCNKGRNHMYVIFQVDCSNGVAVGFTPSVTEKTKVYEIELSHFSNTKSTIKRIRNTDVKASHEEALCKSGSSVSLWAKITNNTITVGKGETVDENEIMKYVDDNPLEVKYVYFSSYSDKVKISGITIGPTNFESPVLTVKDIVSEEYGMIIPVSLSHSGKVYCFPRLYPSTTPLRQHFLSYGSYVRVEADALKNIHVYNLTGGARYSVWCYGEDDNGVPITDDNMYKQGATVTVKGSSAYPIPNIYYIAGKKNSLKISCAMNVIGTLMAYAVPVGSAKPTQKQIKNYGQQFYLDQANREYDVEYTKGVVYLVSYDVYFITISISGITSPENMIAATQHTVDTDGTCEIFNNVECNNEGNCVDGECMCNPGYHGYNCNVQCAGWTGESDCNGHGDCDGFSGGCKCNRLYHGAGCNIQCPNNGKEECNGHGFCNVEENKGVCHCQSPYEGSGCEIGPNEKKKRQTTFIIIGAVCGVVVLIGIAGLIIWLNRAKIPKALPTKVKAKGDLDADVWMYNQLS